MTFALACDKMKANQIKEIVFMSAREKSALYPNATWNDCIEFVKTVDSFKLKSVAYIEVAKKLGLNSVATKSFTGKISTSKQFGLITTSSSTIQLTDTCRRLLYPTGNDVYAIKHACFSQPPLYNKLITIYDGKALPSEEILSNILMTDHKIAKAVKNLAAKCFLKSAEELELIKGGVLCYAESEQNHGTTNALDDDSDSIAEDAPIVVQERKQTIQSDDADYITQSIPTQSGKVAKIIIPIDAAEDDLYMIKDMLDVVLKRKFKLSDI